ncbi:hypothetical protein Tco_0403883 [Tanacetum coccineum]
MEDKHLDTIPEMESDELIMSNVEDLFHTPSESDGISESKCNFPICDDSSLKNDEVLDDIISIPPGIVKADFDPKGYIHFIENLMYDNSFSRPPKTLKDDYETIIDSNDDYSSSDDDSPYSEDIDYVDALPPDPELLSLEVVGNVVQEDGEIDTDILLTIKDDILRKKMLKVNLLIAKIEETNTFDNSLPQFETFNFLDDHTKETSSGSTTGHADISLPKYDSFHLDSEPDSRDFTMDVVEDIFDNLTREPRVHVPSVLPTHPTLHLDSDFILSCDSLGSDLVVSFPSETRNKIFDQGIFIKIQSKRFLSPN